MLTRMLTDLKQIYFNSKQYDIALPMIDHQALCVPDASIAAMNRRDRGICMYLSGRFVEAIAELQGFLDAYAAAVDRQAVEGALSLSTHHAAATLLTARAYASRVPAAIDICRAALAARKLSSQLDGDEDMPADDASDQ